VVITQAVTDLAPASSRSSSSTAARVPGLERFHVHVRCFPVWELERERAPAWLPRATPPPPPSRRASLSSYPPIHEHPVDVFW